MNTLRHRVPVLALTLASFLTPALLTTGSVAAQCQFSDWQELGGRTAHSILRAVGSVLDLRHTLPGA